MSYQQHFPSHIQPPPSQKKNSNHHSPPSLAGSNSFSSFVWKGPLLWSLGRALIWGSMLNKEERKDREKQIYGKTTEPWKLLGVNQSSARGCKGPWLGCVWSVSFKGGAAGRAITGDLPLAAGPAATLTESNHKQVNSTSTFLIFFPPVSFFWSCSVDLDDTLLVPLPSPTTPSPVSKRGREVCFQYLLKPPELWLFWFY